MSDRLVSRDMIDNLRRVAQTRDWNQWEPALECALAELKPEVLLPLAEAALRQGLTTFERNNPGETWPRRALDGLETGLGPDDHPGPGGNAFASGVEDLVEARERIHEPDACRTLIANALGESVMATMAAAWGEDHPEHWKRLRQIRAEGRNPTCAESRLGWSQEPKIQKLQFDGWNALIDRLEALKRRPASGNIDMIAGEHE